jgi:hypothetical protein
VEKPDRPAATSRPHNSDQIRTALTPPRIPGRWIEVQESRTKIIIVGEPEADWSALHGKEPREIIALYTVSNPKRPKKSRSA